MDIMHYVGMDIHKKIIPYCIKKGDGTIYKQGVIRGMDENSTSTLDSCHGVHTVYRLDL